MLRHAGPILTGLGFQLGGGSAIALQLGHRRSVDWDWFSVNARDVEIWERKLKNCPLSFRFLKRDEGTLHVTLSGVRVTLLRHEYPILRPAIPWATYGIQVLSLPDLAAMKLAAVSQRGARKDFIDLFAIGRKHLSLREMLRAYRKKYGTEDIGHVLYSLAYFEDADRERMTGMIWKCDWRDVKTTFENWVRNFSRR